MFQKAIRDMQEHIKQHKIDLYQANVGATRVSGENVFTTTFENKKFTKVNIIGLSYNNTPQCLRRYFDDENRMSELPTT